MNLIDNVSLPLVYAGVDKKQRVSAALEALKKVGLDGFGARLPSQISGGQQQRVAIARALVTNPSIILADEPTGNLDTKMTHEIMELFRLLNTNEKITVILITHEPEVAEYASKIVHVSDGQILQQESSC
jgi:putative ABC transport system ATP-binding protein